MKRSVLLIGCGNMGFAMMRGWISMNPSLKVLVVEPAEDLRIRARSQGAQAKADISDFTNHSPDIVVIAVKPHQVPKVAKQCAPFVAGGAIICSVAAGISIREIANGLPDDAAIVRCMPNTPASIGEGVMALCANPAVSHQQSEQIGALFSSSGEVIWIEDEAKMDAVTAISGSGPAYVFYFIEAMEEAGVALGLPRDTASKLALKTVAGSGRLAATSDTRPRDLRVAVTSPAGTTAAALEILQGSDRLKSLIREAATAARDRSIELGQSGQLYTSND